MERERIKLRRDLARYELMLRMAWDLRVIDEIEEQQRATRSRLEELEHTPEPRAMRFTVIPGGRRAEDRAPRSWRA